MSAAPSCSPSGGSSRVRRLLAGHSLFGLALLLGIAIRAVVVVAYRPALLYTDTFAYLGAARSLVLAPDRPIGYSLFMRPFVLAFHDLSSAMFAIQLVQHVLGLVLAVVIYAFLRRRGLPGWGATLATLPVLLDPLELVLEHYVLSDFLFATFLVAAVLALFWDHRPGWTAVVVAGLLISFATLVRGAGTFLPVVLVAALLCLRVPWRRLAAFVLAFAVPVVAYVLVYHHQHGEYATTSQGPDFLYARIAPFANCGDPQIHLTSSEHQLCPGLPIAQRPDTNQYRWDVTRSPLASVEPVSGPAHEQLVSGFDKAVLRAQPVTYAKAVLEDFGRGFAPTRTEQVPGYPSQYWLFAKDYWIGPIDQSAGIHDPIMQRVSADTGAATFLAHYRTYLYLPGPLAALLLLLGAVAALGLGRSRRSGDRVLIGTLTGSCVMVLVTSAALSSLSWRYQLPQITLIPMAGALALAALVRGPAASAPEPLRPLRPLDRAAALLSTLPRSPRVRRTLERATRRGVVQTVVALCLGAATMVLVALGAVASGYARPAAASVVGFGAGAVVAVLLVAARARQTREDLRGGVRDDASDDPSDDPSDEPSEEPSEEPGDELSGSRAGSSRAASR